jgi:hypothetical protein
MQAVAMQGMQGMQGMQDVQDVQGIQGMQDLVATPFHTRIFDVLRAAPAFQASLAAAVAGLRRHEAEFGYQHKDVLQPLLVALLQAGRDAVDACSREGAAVADLDLDAAAARVMSGQDPSPPYAVALLLQALHPDVQHMSHVLMLCRSFGDTDADAVLTTVTDRVRDLVPDGVAGGGVALPAGWRHVRAGDVVGVASGVPTDLSKDLSKDLFRDYVVALVAAVRCSDARSSLKEAAEAGGDPTIYHTTMTKHRHVCDYSPTQAVIDAGAAATYGWAAVAHPGVHRRRVYEALAGLSHPEEDGVPAELAAAYRDYARMSFSMSHACAPWAGPVGCLRPAERYAFGWLEDICDPPMMVCGRTGLPVEVDSRCDMFPMTPAEARAHRRDELRRCVDIRRKISVDVKTEGSASESTDAPVGCVSPALYVRRLLLGPDPCLNTAWNAAPPTPQPPKVFLDGTAPDAADVRLERRVCSAGRRGPVGGAMNVSASAVTTHVAAEAFVRQHVAFLTECRQGVLTEAEAALLVRDAPAVIVACADRPLERTAKRRRADAADVQGYRS